MSNEIAAVAMERPVSEFQMSDEDFDRVSKLAYEYTGIVLGPHKRDMVYGRLARRLRALNLRTVTEYCELIDAREKEEVSQFINSITTNLTSFFRESHHFDYLRSAVLPGIVARNRNKRLRAWSAGSSTGEEVYSIAMTIKDSNLLAGWDWKLLATDLDSRVLEHGRRGEYDIERVAGLDQSLKKRWFVRDKVRPNVVAVRPELNQAVSFKRLNLLETWPMKGPFDFIFCRNVVIYFDQETQRVLFNRFADMLTEGGHLFIGHSESLHRTSNRFEPVGRTVYRKIGA